MIDRRFFFVVLCLENYRIFFLKKCIVLLEMLKESADVDDDVDENEIMNAFLFYLMFDI